MGFAGRWAEIGRFACVVACAGTLAWLGNGSVPWWPLTWLAPLSTMALNVIMSLKRTGTTYTPPSFSILIIDV